MMSPSISNDFMPSHLRIYWSELRRVNPDAVRAQQLRLAIQDTVAEARNYRRLLSMYLDRMSVLGDSPAEKLAKQKLSEWVEQAIDALRELIGEDED